ncbi:MAG: hypothetical protein V2I51_04495 [Anderseniella sp.]|jgi:hypothetical protein|nr:hypothetical protein [Anderseniella sp.]
MYSVNRIADEVSDGNGQQPVSPDRTRRHQDISPELKEVMHLLKVMEDSEDLK